MIKPNWDIFKAKYSENPQENFEWFCYLLFSKEHNQPYGIHRYKNQSGIETDPIGIDGEVIGWQAKFYSNSLSEHKADLIATLEKSKRDYPHITKIILYTNSEWGQGRGHNEPVAKTETEQKANDLGIELVWRVKSYFESEFVVVTNEIIAKHFFTLEKSFFDVIQEQEKHTETILNQIQTGISYKGQCFEIDRTQCLEQIKDKSQQVSILSGVGGVGKTVLIKKLHEELKIKTPFYVFKANEFKLTHLNDLFSGICFSDFIEAHKKQDTKIIVIDSAEKLLDLKNLDPFKEFLSVLISENWKIIFTTRNNYLEDLNYQFFEIYNIAPLNINISNLEPEELRVISEKQLFSLPKDEKLLELIRNPFYLNEYLKFYNETEELNYSDFKTKLWNRKIKNAKPVRERCFLQIAFERATSGQFFINTNCESTTLDELQQDGILGYEQAGYFITHDIYEEWALEKIIENEFIKKSTEKEFFNNIGQSLPIRRSFRNWISEKLLLENDEIKTFIENIIESQEIESFWKDEIIISVLLSDFSKVFFEYFKEELLDNEQVLLKRITFILRIACKEVDNDYFEQLGIKNLNLFSLKYVLTKPKGQGWKNLIKFVFDNLETIGIKNINFILPVIYDWNNKVKEGVTTKFSCLIALRFYQWTIQKDVYFSGDNTQEDLFKTICFGASEIKDELEGIFDEIIKNKWKNHKDPYYDFSKFILHRMECLGIAKVLPKSLLGLAELFWTRTKKGDVLFHHASLDIEEYFGLDKYSFDYNPASAYQTPIYLLLQTDLMTTINFIIKFVNESVENFAKSEFAKHEVEEVNIYVNNKTVKQYISNRLWCIYRGTQVSPNILESIHMALEKYLIENGKNLSSETLSILLFHLLENSKSASISAIVTSVIMAYPEKTFNVAKVLFQTQAFFQYDSNRFVLDQSHKNELLTLKNTFPTNFKNEIYESERLNACDDKHRSSTLESVFRNYQFFRSEDINEEVADKRQKELWAILDNYYKQLPSIDKQTEADKTWRLYLARMDRRKMDVTTEKVDGGISIQFNPELTPDLKEYSQNSLEKSSEFMKHTSLRLWSDYKFKGSEESKKYTQYENDPKQALKEVKNIIKKLNTIKTPERSKIQLSDEENFYLFNHSIPAFVCSVVLRDYFDAIDEEEKVFCKDLILEVSASALQQGYQYQVSDGVQQAFSVLPILLEMFPEEKENIKAILLLGLFKEGKVGGFLDNESFSIFSIMAIRQLWKKDFNDAQSLLFGYLLLKSKYDDLREEIRVENYKKGIYNSASSQAMEKLLDQNEESLKKIIDCKIELDSIKDIEKFDLYTLGIAFQIIPIESDNEDHKKLIKIISSVFANKILLDKHDEKVDYLVKHSFLEKYSYIVLNASQENIKDYLNPFLDNFNKSESIADLFKEIVSAEDRLDTYDNFWFIWSLFKEKVFEICKDGDGYWYIDKIVRSYLFAEVRWKESAKDWHSFKDNNKKFFKDISNNIGHCPSTLYAISKLLNGIGSPYIDDGLIWISTILENNQNYIDKKLEPDTLYFMENLVKKYTYKNREQIKKSKLLKDKLIVILNFLIERGSVIGYMLRESII